MAAERAQLYDSIRDIDKNIESTEQLLNSLLPNVAKIFANKVKKHKKQEQQKLSNIWQDRKEKALSRGDKDCPICYSRLAIKDCVLLDCTHVYHKCCLEAFERYDVKPTIDAYRAGLEDGSGI